MRKYILLIALISMSCSGKNYPEPDKTNPKIDTDVWGHYIEVKEIDSCEYIIVSGTYAVALVHKQNCKNH